MPFKIYESNAHTVSLDVLTRRSGNPSIGAIELRGLPQNSLFSAFTDGKITISKGNLQARGLEIAHAPSP
jgi:hypothetical protein